MSRLVCISGLPGSGKSTILKLLVENYADSISYDIDDAMPEDFKLQMSSGSPISPSQRAELFATVCSQLTALSNTANGIVFAGLVLVSEAHRLNVMGCCSSQALYIELDAPLDILCCRAMQRQHHFFNSAALKALYDKKEPIHLRHCVVDVNCPLEVVMKHVVELVDAFISGTLS